MLDLNKEIAEQANENKIFRRKHFENQGSVKAQSDEQKINHYLYTVFHTNKDGKEVMELLKKEYCFNEKRKIADPSLNPNLAFYRQGFIDCILNLCQRIESVKKKVG